MVEDFRLLVDGAPDLVFSGQLVARVSNIPVAGAESFSRHLGRWRELALYRTEGGTYVCHEARRSSRLGERELRHRAEAVATESAVIAFFKQTMLAKRLYAEAGIANVRRAGNHSDLRGRGSRHS
jgi:hypothetical protein